MIGWLLTPAVVWAAAFFGAWGGAVVGGRLAWLLGGAVAGGAAGIALWGVVAALRRGRPPAPADAEEPGAGAADNDR